MYLLAPFETTTIFIRIPPLATQNSCESAMFSRFGIQPQGPRMESYIVRVSVELPGRVHRRDSLLIPKSPSVQRNQVPTVSAFCYGHSTPRHMSLTTRPRGCGILVGIRGEDFPAFLSWTTVSPDTQE